MSLLFELEQHQKLVVYEEGNQILAVRLPLRRGGEFRMRDGLSVRSDRGDLQRKYPSCLAVTGTSYYSVRDGGAK